MQHISNGVEETAKIAEQFTAWIHEKSVGTREGAKVVGLYGDLGAGKTTFMQAVAKAFGVVETVTSPTFVIEKIYGLENDTEFDRLVHIDAYRLQGGTELHHIGWQEIVADTRNVVFVEWAERVDDAFPKGAVKVEFHHKGGDMREIVWQ